MRSAFSWAANCSYQPVFAITRKQHGHITITVIIYFQKKESYIKQQTLQRERETRTANDGKL